MALLASYTPPCIFLLHTKPWSCFLSPTVVHFKAVLYAVWEDHTPVSQAWVAMSIRRAVGVMDASWLFYTELYTVYFLM